MFYTSILTFYMVNAHYKAWLNPLLPSMYCTWAAVYAYFLPSLVSSTFPYEATLYAALFSVECQTPEKYIITQSSTWIKLHKTNLVFRYKPISPITLLTNLYKQILRISLTVLYGCDFLFILPVPIQTNSFSSSKYHQFSESKNVQSSCSHLQTTLINISSAWSFQLGVLLTFGTIALLQGKERSLTAMVDKLNFHRNLFAQLIVSIMEWKW